MGSSPVTHHPQILLGTGKGRTQAAIFSISVPLSLPLHLATQCPIYVLPEPASFSSLLLCTELCLAVPTP